VQELGDLDGTPRWTVHHRSIDDLSLSVMPDKQWLTSLCRCKVAISATFSILEEEKEELKLVS
jgi:hypothetical protein